MPTLHVGNESTDNRCNVIVKTLLVLLFVFMLQI